MVTYESLFGGAPDAARRELAGYAQFPMFSEDIWESDPNVQNGADPVMPGQGGMALSECGFAHQGWSFMGWLRASVAANVPAEIRSAIQGNQNTTYIGALFNNTNDKKRFLVSIRGTEGLFEWLQNGRIMPNVVKPEGGATTYDLKFGFHLPTMSELGTSAVLALLKNAPDVLDWLKFFPDSPVDAHVGTAPDGFYSMYKSLVYGQLAAVDGILSAIGDEYNDVTVVGHSLGAALGAYLCADLAGRMGANVGKLNGYFFATPHPGNDAFADYADRAGFNYVSIIYERDAVPLVPPGQYVALRRTVTIVQSGETDIGQILAKAQTKDGLKDNHHAICYAAMLDPDVSSHIECVKLDGDCVNSIATPSAVPTIGSARLQLP